MCQIGYLYQVLTVPSTHSVLPKSTSWSQHQGAGCPIRRPSSDGRPAPAGTGIDTKPRGLAADDVPAAATLYQAGWSLARIGEKFGITDDTVRARLLEVGIAMRDPHGRKQ
jgi:hypothetical protein